GPLPAPRTRRTARPPPPYPSAGSAPVRRRAHGARRRPRDRQLGRHPDGRRTVSGSREPAGGRPVGRLHRRSGRRVPRLAGGLGRPEEAAGEGRAPSPGPLDGVVDPGTRHREQGARLRRDHPAGGRHRGRADPHGGLRSVARGRAELAQAAAGRLPALLPKLGRQRGTGHRRRPGGDGPGARPGDHPQGRHLASAGPLGDDRVRRESVREAAEHPHLPRRLLRRLAEGRRRARHAAGVRDPPRSRLRVGRDALHGPRRRDRLRAAARGGAGRGRRARPALRRRHRRQRPAVHLSAVLGQAPRRRLQQLRDLPHQDRATLQHARHPADGQGGRGGVGADRDAAEVREPVGRRLPLVRSPLAVPAGDAVRPAAHLGRGTHDSLAV
ncbi:MAG: GH6, partial [uncultured Nocardioidaceae bacterium]